MNANELMIDDWVQGFVPDTYSRVVAIPCAYRLGIITSGGHYIETAPDDFQPIPITPEILEKNGFKKDTGGEECGANSKGWEVEICGKINSFDGVIKYIHELQHALRLCGIEKEIEL